MSTTRGRTLALAMAATLVMLAGACSGSSSDEGDPGDGSAGQADGPGAKGGSDDKEPAAEGPAADIRCDRDVAGTLPEGFDPEICWTLFRATNPVLAGDRLFGILVTGNDDPEGAGTVVAGYDLATGEKVWTSGLLPSEVAGLTATEVDGEPGIAALVTETDEGDAVTESATNWGYMAWPADAEDDGTGAKSADPPVHITTEYNGPSFTDLVWTDQGLIAEDALLAAGADEFVPVEREPEPVVVNSYSLSEELVGPSGDLVLSYVRDVAYGDGSPDGVVYDGWQARNPDGSPAWDSISDTPRTDEIVESAGGLTGLPVLVGAYALTVTATDVDNTAFEVEWLDAATGGPATPSAADLAGSEAVGVTGDSLATDVVATLAPDGAHLFISWNEVAIVVDVEAGTATPVESDFAISAQGIDETTVYGTTPNGALTVDLATAEATPLDDPLRGPVVVNDDYGVFDLSQGSFSGTFEHAIARRA
jgi:hypothetical protein